MSKKKKRRRVKLIVRQRRVARRLHESFSAEMPNATDDEIAKEVLDEMEDMGMAKGINIVLILKWIKLFKDVWAIFK